MDKIHDIRQRFYAKGEKISQIANELQLDRKTVQKYVDKTDFNQPAPKPASNQRLCPKLDPYKPTIDKWLKEDKQAPRKGGDRETTERFERFRQHYRFQAIFMNPGEGHEKGNVENKVGYQRRNFLVPIPRFLSLPDYNRQLLELCEEDAFREHYRHNETIEELFQEDLKACHPLPEIEFDLSGKMTVTAN